jgi:hypothetical protein
VPAKLDGQSAGSPLARPTFWSHRQKVALTFASIGGVTWLAGGIYANTVIRLGARCAS